MEKRKLSDVRIYLKEVTVTNLIPESRVAQQIVDLQLLKYAVKVRDYDEPMFDRLIVEKLIDTCIDGFIWLYAHGGTHNTLPSIIEENAEAKNYYDNFCIAWSELQEYMRTNMSLMDM